MPASSPEPTLVEKAADKCLWCRRLMPSNLLSTRLLLTLSACTVLMTGDNEDERTCWAFYISSAYEVRLLKSQ